MMKQSNNCNDKFDNNYYMFVFKIKNNIEKCVKFVANDSILLHRNQRNMYLFSKYSWCFNWLYNNNAK